ncbi:hypothetical protein VNI00_019239 [Paramarasmius palmivorus]|uniref:Uncharacterized protein n=1 Tax=Paramarasmius palmivorus TaxID=297713 RepID=A0AAW0AP80_9AGAR
MAFTGSRSLTIEGNAINNVGRDQYNLNNSFTRVVGTRVKRKQKKREDEYDQYREIIHGDIYKVEEIDSQNIWELKWETHKHRDSGDSFRRTTHHARLHGEGDKPYTVLTYQGRDALELFGMNRSNVPALIFYDGA